MPEKNQTVNTVAMAMEPEVPHQLTVPPYAKSTFDLKSAEFGHTRRVIMLEDLRKVGVVVTDEDIGGRRGANRK